MCVCVDVSCSVVQILKEVCTGRSLVSTQMTMLVDVLVQSVSVKRKMTMKRDRDEEREREI